MSSYEIPLSRPDITDAEVEIVSKVLRSGRLSLGPMVEQFERHVAQRADALEAVAVSSGTCGLQLALLALGIGPGDEVITTPFSFIASSNVILMVGARPVFVDICPKTLNMDPDKIEGAITPRTKAILAVECFGNTAYMDKYAAIAARHEIGLVEDCCEALGATLNGRPAGSFGRVGVFGFYPNKQITTGEGGMIVSNDRRLADMCRSMRNQGRAIPKLGADGAGMGSGGTAANAPAGGWLHHERLGFNYRMSEINAALGVAQMRRFDDILARRRRVAEMYFERLMAHPDFILPTLPDGVQNSWFVFVVRMASAYTREERDRVIAGMTRHDIGARDYFPCIHLQPFYREKFGFAPGDFPIAESVSQRTIALPFFNDMSAQQVELVSQTLEVMLGRENLRRG